MRKLIALAFPLLLAAAVFLAPVEVLGQQYNVPFNPPAVAGGCSDSDDFSGDLSCWSECPACVAWTISGGELNAPSQAFAYVEHDNVHAEDQWMKFQIGSYPLLLSTGILMRGDGSGGGYYFRLSADKAIRWGTTTNYCDTQSTINTISSLPSLADTDYLAVTAVGHEGDGLSDTVITFWFCGTTDPGTYVSDSAWNDSCGSAEAQFTDTPGTEFKGASQVGFCGGGNIANQKFDNFAAGDI